MSNDKQSKASRIRDHFNKTVKCADAIPEHFSEVVLPQLLNETIGNLIELYTESDDLVRSDPQHCPYCGVTVDGRGICQTCSSVLQMMRVIRFCTRRKIEARRYAKSHPDAPPRKVILPYPWKILEVARMLKATFPAETVHSCILSYIKEPHIKDLPPPPSPYEKSVAVSRSLSVEKQCIDAVKCRCIGWESVTIGSIKYCPCVDDALTDNKIIDESLATSPYINAQRDSGLFSRALSLLLVICGGLSRFVGPRRAAQIVRKTPEEVTVQMLVGRVSTLKLQQMYQTGRKRKRT